MIVIKIVQRDILLSLALPEAKLLTIENYLQNKKDAREATKAAEAIVSLSSRQATRAAAGVLNRARGDALAWNA